MCGRYAATASPDQLAEELEVDADRTAEPGRSILVAPQSPPPATPDFNMAPSKRAPVVVRRTPRGEDRPETSLRLLTWGLVPSWAPDVTVGMRMINARAESVLGKNAYATAARSRRCLVPAAGWYEWQRSPAATDSTGRARKQPFFTHRADGGTCALAGLYELWRDPAVAEGSDPAAWLATFTIVTTQAEPGLEGIHDRQPLVLEPEDWPTWLDPQMQDPDEVARLLAFRSDGRFEAYPVSTAVNGSRNNGPQLIQPLPADRGE